MIATSRRAAIRLECLANVSNQNHSSLWSPPTPAAAMAEITTVMAWALTVAPSTKAAVGNIRFGYFRYGCVAECRSVREFNSHGHI